MAIKRRPPTSIKQVLTRDFNWLMGNLRRLYHNTYGLDPDLANRVQEAAYEQMEREKYRHTARLKFLETGNLDCGGYDNVFIDAKFEVERNKRALQHP